MNSDQNTNLQKLRGDILNELVGLKDYLIQSNDVSYEMILTLVRATGDSSLLELAFKKAQQIEDARQKADALIDILDEVEVSLSSSTPPSEVSQSS